MSIEKVNGKTTLVVLMFYDAVDNSMSFLHDVLTLSFAQRSQHHDHVTTLWSSPAHSSAVVCILLILFVSCSTVNKLRSEDPWAYAWRTAARPAVLTRKSAAVSVMALVWLWRTWEGHRRVQALVCNPLYAGVGLCYGESSDPYTITVIIQSK